MLCRPNEESPFGLVLDNTTGCHTTR